jgi:hypothetical protein
VPLARDRPYYLTRIYAPREQAVRLRLTRNKQLAVRLWCNEEDITAKEMNPVRLRREWNTIGVRIEGASPSTGVLLHPREGFYLRLDFLEGEGEALSDR